MDALTAMKQAREVLENLQGGCTDSNDGTVEAITVWCPEAIAALDAAIEQAERAEPVAWIDPKSMSWLLKNHAHRVLETQLRGAHVAGWTPLYAAPVATQNQWRDVVDDMLAVCESVATDDPRESINRLINWHVTVALDPSVSSDAAALVERGRAQPVHQPVHGWTEADADAARLALELECILTDKDQTMPSISRWWDSAHEALELHRQRMAEPPTESMDRRAATARPAPAKADLSASGPPITDDDLRAMMPKSTVKKRYFSEVGNLLAYPVWTEQQMLDYGRAIARRCGGMK